MICSIGDGGDVFSKKPHIFIFPRARGELFSCFQKRLLHDFHYILGIESHVPHKRERLMSQIPTN